MKKFLLVVLIGMVLTLDVCGIVKEIVSTFENEEVDHIKETVTIVYEE